MRPFIEQEYIKPNKFEILLKKIPDKNFLIDINNLLAKGSLNDLSPEQVISLSKKYNIKNPAKKYKNELIQFIHLFLIEHLGNTLSDSNDYRSAQKLQQILNVPDSDFNEKYQSLASMIFKSKVEETLNATMRFQEVEEKILENIRVDLEIPKEEAEVIINQSRSTILQQYMNKMLEDFKVSPEEMDTFDKLCKDFAVQPQIDEKSRAVIEKYRLIWNIENAELPVFDADVFLTKSEICHFKSNATLYENRNVTKRVGYSGLQFRVKIVRGIYYKAGDYAVERQSENVLTPIDVGVLYVTNKRIIFNGNKQNKVIKYNQVVDLTTYLDGVLISKDSGKSPTFLLPNEDGQILAATIVRIINDTQQ